MYRQTSIPEGAEQWLINLIELKNRVEKSCKQIADEENLAEKSVCNVFLGVVKNPGVDLMRRIIHSLGGHWDEIFGESGAVIGGQDLATLQAEVDRLTEEVALLTNTLTIANSNLLDQKNKISELETENKILSLKYEYDEKIIAIYDFYNKINTNNKKEGI